MIAAALIVVASIFLSPVFSSSASPCGSCHGGYSQYLDVLEGNAANQLPTALTVGQTATVSVVVENRVNTVLFSSLSSVSLSLTSQSGHFSVGVPTFSVGTLAKGTATATWQITGVSAGSDTLVISASARNVHQNLQFSDTYSPVSGITISTSATTPTPIVTPTPTTMPAATPTPSSPSTPTTNPTIAPDPTSSSTPTPTQAPTQATSEPTTSPQPNSTSDPKNELPNNSQEQNKPSDLKIWFTTLSEGETLTAGNKTIEWTTSGGSGNSNTKLELSKSGIGGPWTVLAENLTNTNSFVWIVPNQSANYIIRVTVADIANPLQIASSTAVTKIISAIHIETLMMTILSYAMVLLSTTLLAIISKNRLTKIGYLKTRNMLN